jgi:hypothetical protein
VLQAFCFPAFPSWHSTNFWSPQCVTSMDLHRTDSTCLKKSMIADSAGHHCGVDGMHEEQSTTIL